MSNCSGKKERFFNLAILAGLALIELCCFGGAIEHSGLYLDDWQMICQLHFGPQSFLEATGSLLSVDPRVAIRPVEAPYFALLYLLFGIQPIAYHVVNAVTEVLAAWFLCLSVNKLIGSRFLSAAAALAFLLYPAHDSTHYWIVASSVTLSGLVYLISLWLSVCGAADGNTRLHWLSGLAFAISLFNYESFLPLITLNLGAVYSLSCRKKPSLTSIKEAVTAVAPHLLAIPSLWYYQRHLVPLFFGKAWSYKIDLDPGQMAHIVSEGVRVSCSPYAFAFFWQQASVFLTEQFNPLPILLVFPISMLSLWIASSDDHASRGAGKLVILGVVTILCSFTIFGLNPDYVPRLDTTMNRINTGASIGISMVIAGLSGCLFQILERAFAKKAGALTGAICTSSTLMLFFALANQGFSRPWLLSASMQDHICKIVAREGDWLSARSSVFLSRCPRYIDWSPMFDGVWDFQSMVRIVLNNPQITGGVMSDRIVFSPDRVKDVARGTLCGEYPFKDMAVITPDPERVVRVNSQDEFVSAVR